MRQSDYSPQDGAQSVKQIAAKAAQLGMDSVALTDHGRAGGLLKFKKACEENKVKPIYGVELYVAPESRFTKHKLETHNKTSYHLTVLAKNEEGLKNIFRLTSYGWTEGFYYKPRVDMELLERYKEGLIVLSGCGAGRASVMLQEGRVQAAEQWIEKSQNIWGDDFYIEIQNHGLEWQPELNAQLIAIANSKSIPLVATQDSHYIQQSDAELHNMICKISAGDLQFDSDQSWFKSTIEMREMFPNQPNAVDLTQEVANKCNCNWEYDRTIWPVYPTEEKTPEETLRSLAWQGFKNFFGDGTDEYHKRLEYELDIITQMGFPTYFLVVADFINWAKQNGIAVGPGRGSAAGSLVCYVTGITEVDPIKYGLYFERFLNPSRISLPDIDVDFCKRDREKVIQYVTNKYGAEKIAQIGVYHLFKPKGSLRDFARACGHDKGVGEYLAKMIPPPVAGKPVTFDTAIQDEPQLLKTKYPEVVDYARRAQGLISKAGVHAAGLVISDVDINSIVPLFKAKNEAQATQFDMDNVEELGLVKFDFLGLKNLTVIQDTINLIKEKGIDIDISSIDVEDQKVYQEIFQQGDLDGVFQFETSGGFKDLCVRVKPQSILDLSAITSLFRPGPLRTGAVDRYVEARGGKAPEYAVDELEPILKDTGGVMAFQEQIMNICTDIAGYTLSEADNMRKIIGKKIEEKMKAERIAFVSGCIKAGFDENFANDLFKDIEGFAAYSFNKSHAVAYSLISFKTAWLKVYYPHEFYTALLNNSLKDQDDLIKYINACKEHEVPIESPDINRSKKYFSLDNGTIVFGFAGIHGIGPKDSDDILAKRPDEGFKDLAHAVDCGLGLGKLKSLAGCGALDEISNIERGVLLEELSDLVKYYEKQKAYEERLGRIKERELEREIAIANGEKPPNKLPKINEKYIPKKPKLSESSSFSRADKLKLERELLGYYLSGHPLDDYPGLLRASRCTIEGIKSSAQHNDYIKILVVLSDITEIRTRTGKNMATIKLEDKTGLITGTIFPNNWKKIKNKIRKGEPAIVSGSVEITQPEIDEDEEKDEVPVRIARLIVKDVNQELKDSGSVIEPMKHKLPSGHLITFYPCDNQNYSKWQQALAILKNLERN